MMAQLPPKVPNMYSLWPSFPHQRAPSMNNMLSISSASQPSWVEGFTDFSPHRRSASDSIAFLECQSEATGMGPSDEQLMSMFSDQISAMGPPANSTSNPSSSSDHDEKSTPLDQQPRNEPEVQSPCQTDTQITTPPADPITDPKRVKRILANRQSAQRSRVRKLQYVTDLERSVATLQTEVSALSPRVAFLDHQRLVLNIDNSALKQRIAALAQDKIFKDAHQEALKKEVERLRQVYYQQALNKMDSSSTNTCSEPYIYTETATQLK